MKKLFIIFFFIFGIGYALVVLVGDFRSSSFFQKKDRINIVFYGENARFYSIDTLGEVNYQASLDPDLKVLVPGGYGYYRVGALGKLAFLEKNDDIVRRAFSSLFSNMITFYFLTPKNDVYFGSKSAQKKAAPGMTEVWQTLVLRSNARFFDRIMLAFLFLRKQGASFTEVKEFPLDESGRFSASGFAKASKGLFYEKSYRNENKSVQIIYTKSEKTAFLLSQILEGEGIRVADMTQNIAGSKACVVKELEKNASLTARAIAGFFNCSIASGEATSPYDMIVIMGLQEDRWAAE